MTSATNTCEHTHRTLLSPWELLRKYVCTDCGAVMTCACDQDLATYVSPYYAERGRDQYTKDEVKVTHPLVLDVCYTCRGEAPPSHPTAAHRGASSNVHRYYWHEIWKETERDFLAWCRDSGLPLLDSAGQSLVSAYHGGNRERHDEIRKSVVERWKVRHEQNPIYNFTRPSAADIISACEVIVEDIEACYLASPTRHVLVLPLNATDPTQAVQVEEFVAQRLQREGRKVMFCESRPFQALYASLMWVWVQSPADPRLRMSGFGGRDEIGADERGIIWTLLPHDFGSPAHARRRQQALQEHMNMLPNDTDGLLWAYDYWQEPSRPLRQYLWAYTQEDQERARTLIRVLKPQRIKMIMQYLAEDYWGRFLGWPDLLSWREEPSGPDSFEFIEVKSSGDKLSDDQRSWIEGNRQHLHFPFRIAKIHRTQRLSTT
jgi:hypothetical protein